VEQLDDLGGGGERIGDRPAVQHRHGHLQLAAHLGYEQRSAGDGGAVQSGQANEAGSILEAGASDRNRSTELDHPGLESGTAAP
jgi:hypothetical protein